MKIMKKVTFRFCESPHSTGGAAGIWYDVLEGRTISKNTKTFDDCVILSKETFDPDAVYRHPVNVAIQEARKREIIAAGRHDSSEPMRRLSSESSKPVAANAAASASVETVTRGGPSPTCSRAISARDSSRGPCVAP